MPKNYDMKAEIDDKLKGDKKKADEATEKRTEEIISESEGVVTSSEEGLMHVTVKGTGQKSAKITSGTQIKMPQNILSGQKKLNTLNSQVGKLVDALGISSKTNTLNNKVLDKMIAQSAKLTAINDKAVKSLSAPDLTKLTALNSIKKKGLTYANNVDRVPLANMGSYSKQEAKAMMKEFASTAVLDNVLDKKIKALESLNSPTREQKIDLAESRRQSEKVKSEIGNTFGNIEKFLNKTERRKFGSYQDSKKVVPQNVDRQEQRIRRQYQDALTAITSGNRSKLGSRDRNEEFIHSLANDIKSGKFDTRSYAEKSNAYKYANKLFDSAKNGTAFKKAFVNDLGKELSEVQSRYVKRALYGENAVSHELGEEYISKHRSRDTNYELPYNKIRENADTEKFIANMGDVMRKVNKGHSSSMTSEMDYQFDKLFEGKTSYEEAMRNIYTLARKFGESSSIFPEEVRKAYEGLYSIDKARTQSSAHNVISPTHTDETVAEEAQVSIAGDTSDIDKSTQAIEKNTAAKEDNTDATKENAKVNEQTDFFNKINQMMEENSKINEDNANAKNKNTDATKEYLDTIKSVTAEEKKAQQASGGNGGGGNNGNNGNGGNGGNGDNFSSDAFNEFQQPSKTIFHKRLGKDGRWIKSVQNTYNDEGVTLVNSYDTSGKLKESNLTVNSKEEQLISQLKKKAEAKKANNLKLASLIKQNRTESEEYKRLVEESKQIEADSTELYDSLITSKPSQKQLDKAKAYKDQALFGDKESNAKIADARQIVRNKRNTEDAKSYLKNLKEAIKERDKIQKEVDGIKQKQIKQDTGKGTFIPWEAEIAESSKGLSSADDKINNLIRDGERISNKFNESQAKQFNEYKKAQEARMNQFKGIGGKGNGLSIYDEEFAKYNKRFGSTTENSNGFTFGGNTQNWKSSIEEKRAALKALEQEYNNYIALNKKLMGMGIERQGSLEAEGLKRQISVSGDELNRRIQSAYNTGIDRSRINKALASRSEEFKASALTGYTKNLSSAIKEIDRLEARADKAGRLTKSVQEQINSARASVSKYANAVDLNGKAFDNYSKYQKLFESSSKFSSGTASRLNDWYKNANAQIASDKVKEMYEAVSKARNISIDNLRRSGKISTADFKPTGIDAIISQWNKLAEGITNAKKKVNDAASGKIKLGSNEIAATNSQIAEMTTRLSALSPIIDKTYKSFQGTGSSTDVTVNSMKELSKETANVAKGMGYVNTAYIKQDEMSKKITASYENEKGSRLNLVTSMDTFGRKMNIESSSVQPKRSALSTFASEAGDFFKMYFGAYTVVPAIIDTFKNGFAQSAAYNRALTNISYTMPYNNKQLQGLGHSALSVARGTGTSMENMMDVYQIYSNMQESTQSIARKAKATAILSNLSGEDAATAADQVQGVMHQFKIKDTAKNATHIVDALDYISANLGIDYGRQKCLAPCNRNVA